MPVEVISMLIPLASVILGIGFGMLSVYLDYRKKREMYELHHRERMAAIEKGVDVPPLPAAFFGTPRKYNPARSLRTALILILAGGVGSVALAQDSEPGAFWWGLIPVAVGVAFFIVFLYERRHPPVEEKAS